MSGDRDFSNLHFVAPWGPATLPGTYSVSQCETFDLCPRKWGFRYIDRIIAENKYAARGTAMHDIAEAYLRDGISPDPTTRYGRLFSTGIPYLPRPGTALTEKGFRYVSRGGVEYVLFIDFIEPEAQPMLVGDHKSTTSLKWALSERDKSERPLRSNPQSTLYAAVVTAALALAAVRVKWVYYEDSENLDLDKPKHARAEPRTVIIDRAHAENCVDKLDATSRLIATARETYTRAHDMPFNPKACGAYGGCPYEETCGLTDLDKMEALMVQMSIRERLMNKPAPANGNGHAHGGAAALLASATGTQAAVHPGPANGLPAGPAAGLPLGPAAGLPQGPAAGLPQGAAAGQPAGGSALAVVQRTQAELAAQQAALAAAAQDAAAQAGSAATLLTQNGGYAVSPGAGVTQAGMSALQRLSASVAPAQTHQQAPQPAATLGAPVATTHAAGDINPPEQPRVPIDDPAQLPQQQSAAAASAAQQLVAGASAGALAEGPAEKKTRTPRAASATGASNVGVSDSGYIFAKVYTTLFIHQNDHDLALDVAEDAVKRYRSLPA